MERGKFGSTGLQVFALGMGCSRLGSFLSTASKRETLATIRLAVERGLDYFDTSDIYGQGESERLLGAALGRDRDRVLLATKAGKQFSHRARLAARIKAPMKFAMKVLPSLRNHVRKARGEHLSYNFDPEYLTTALHASLKRLRTDYVDVFMLHSPPAEILANQELFRRLERLKQEGKIRCLGVSVAEIEHAYLAARLPEVRAIQLPIGRRHASVLAQILPELASQGIAIVGREVFDGFEQTDDQMLRGETLHEAISRPGMAVVLVGMSTKYHLEANLAALD